MLGKTCFLVVILLSVVSIKAIGQVNFFIQGGLNYSLISTLEHSINTQYGIEGTQAITFVDSAYSLKENYDAALGFDFLLGAQKVLSPRFSLETGVGISQITASKNTIETFDMKKYHFAIDGSGNPIGQPFKEEIMEGTMDFEFKKREKFTYLQIPLNLNYTILENRLAVGVGVSSMILLGSRQMRIETFFNSELSPQPNQPKIVEGLKEIEDSSNRGIKQVLWNGDLLLRYRVIGKAWATLGFQYMFSPLFERDYDFKSKGENKLLKLGVRYYF